MAKRAPTRPDTSSLVTVDMSDDRTLRSASSNRQLLLGGHHDFNGTGRPRPGRLCCGSSCAPTTWRPRPVGTRIKQALLVAVTKIFLAGVGWQAGGFLADYCWAAGQHRAPPFTTTVGFMALTGLGDALGVLLGHLLLTLLAAATERLAARTKLETPRRRTTTTTSTRRRRSCDLLLTFSKEAGALALGSVLSGGAWQFVLDACSDAALPFNTSMLLTGGACGFLFWLGLTAGRAVVSLPRATLQDATLGLACGCASACFVGTDMRYAGNWLQGLVGERRGVDGLDCVKAGLSTALGFVAAHVVIVPLLPGGWCWSDPSGAATDSSRQEAASGAAGMPPLLRRKQQSRTTVPPPTPERRGTASSSRSPLRKQNPHQQSLRRDASDGNDEDDLVV